MKKLMVIKLLEFTLLLAEQFDKLWHDINNGTLDNTGEFFTALKEVKDNNPKPGA